jgi:hypothetical protein
VRSHERVPQLRAAYFQAQPGLEGVREKVFGEVGPFTAG